MKQLEMRKAVVLALMLVSFCFAIKSEETLPSVTELTKPETTQTTQDTSEKKEKPVYPTRLSVQEASLPLEMALPENPLLFFETLDRAALGQAFGQTAIGKLFLNQNMDPFWNQNTQALGNLFTDLPKSQEKSGTVQQFAMIWRMTQTVFPQSRRVAMAAYANESGEPVFVFLFEVGRDREPVFAAAEAEMEKILKEYADLQPSIAEKTADYIDVIRSEKYPAMELSMGLVKNYFIIATQQDTAQAIREQVEAGSGDAAAMPSSLGKSEVYRELLGRTDTAAHMRGLVDMQRLLAAFRTVDLAGATEMVDFTCDLAGRGVLYYDYRCDGERIIEHVSSPALAGGAQTPGIPPQIARVTEAYSGGSDWMTRIAKGMPYETEFMFAANTRPERLAKFLEESQPFGTSDYSLQLSIEIPEILRDLVVRRLRGVIGKAMTGEAGMAFLPAGENESPWIIILPLSDAAAIDKILSADQPAATVSGVSIYRYGQDADNGPAYGVLTTEAFPKLPVSYLAIASNMVGLQGVIDHATLGASLAEQEDFTARIKELPEGISVMWYDNLPLTFGSNYRLKVMELAQEVFPPQFRSVSGMPSSSVIRNYLSGMCGGVTVQTGGAVCRSTIVSPMGLTPSMTGMMVLRLPSWMRQRERVFLSTTRANLGKMWLKLQSYATRSGKFPSGSDQTIAPVMQLFTPEERDALFFNPAAVDELGSDGARTNSYRYVSGLRTMDEPDFPLIYEAAPWHYEYDGIMRPAGNNFPRESGEYRRWRLVLTLDGRITAYTESEFVRDVLPRIQAHQ